MRDDEICTAGQDKLVKFVGIVFAIGIVAILLCGCDRGPSEEDMAGCSVRGGGPPITSREVAECAVERAARHEGEVK